MCILDILFEKVFTHKIQIAVLDGDFVLWTWASIQVNYHWGNRAMKTGIIGGWERRLPAQRRCRSASRIAATCKGSKCHNQAVFIGNIVDKLLQDLLLLHSKIRFLEQSWVVPQTSAMINVLVLTIQPQVCWHVKFIFKWNLPNYNRLVSSASPSYHVMMTMVMAARSAAPRHTERSSSTHLLENSQLIGIKRLRF